MASNRTKSKRIPKKPKKAVVEIGKEEDDDRKPGCVYLGHIPHGFYERQMAQYFSQFGKVLDVKLCRSKKTTNSKGYGFVKFKYSAVAKTVAETCHNYLFLNKLLKCEYKPMSEIHRNTFKKIAKPINVPKSQQNNTKTEYKVALSAKTSISKAGKKLEKLKASGLNVDLSDIMDVPDMTKIKEVILTKAPKKKALGNNATTDNLDEASSPAKSTAAKKRKKRKAVDDDNDGATDKPEDVTSSPAEPRTAKKRKTAASSPSTPPAKSSHPPKSSTPASISKAGSGKKTPNKTSLTSDAAATPKSGLKKTNVVAQSPVEPKCPTPKSAGKKTTTKGTTPKSATKKKGGVSESEAAITPKSATKKKGGVSESKATITPKSATKKKSGASPTNASTPKSDTKQNKELTLTGKKSPKMSIKTPASASRKRKRV